MRRFLIAATFLAFLPMPGSAPAQSLDDLNLQVHGYATQGFVYTNHNNWNTTDSSDGSAGWSEAVVNVTAQPESKLRIGVQARYFLLGTYGNQITLDWAQGDYKINERFGLRAGKVKTPSGLLNETQDIDPAQLWILLPQSIYPIASRNSILAHYGGVVYGTLPLGERYGKLEYRGFGGQRVIGAGDGYLEPFSESGVSVPNGFSGPVFGSTFRWKTPLPGLMVGATGASGKLSGIITATPLVGTLSTPLYQQEYFFGRYEHNRVMVAGEYNRQQLQTVLVLPPAPTTTPGIDQRSFYTMASYRISGKLTAGAYYSSILDRKQAPGSARFQKDWDITARYDVNAFLYAKIEQHFMDGTATGFAQVDNPQGLQPNTRMTMLKVGVSF